MNSAHRRPVQATATGLCAVIASLAVLASCTSAPEEKPLPTAPATPKPVQEPATMPTAGNADAVRYVVQFPDAANHYMDVEAQFPTAGKESLQVAMAVWTPGSYLIREYARHLEAVEASDPTGKRLPLEKVSKNRWVISPEGNAAVRVLYRVYCNEFSVRGNYVDGDRAMLNGAPTFLGVVGKDDQIVNDMQHVVRFVLPSSWSKVLTSLRKTDEKEEQSFVARSFDELLDSPLLLGNPTVHEFAVDGKPHKLVNEGEWKHWDGPRSAKDVEAIVNVQHRFWGQLPYEHYLFLNVLGRGRGGLEHLESTLIIGDRLAMTDPDDYKDWLGLVSHEFFHTWNVKRLRPKPLGPFDYENEVYTKSLWIAEGLTSYYDDLLLHRAGLIDRDEYLERVAKNISRFESKQGRAVQSLSESSFDTWIKFYRGNENSNNTSISYYTKGAIVGFLLDAAIRKSSRGQKSLDDVMKEAYRQYSGESGYTPDDFRRIASEMAGSDLSQFFAKYVDGTAPLDYADAMWFYGLELKPKETDDEKGWLGISWHTREGRLIVSEVRRGEAAAAAGISVNDEIIAVDGLRVRGDDLGQLIGIYKPGDLATLTIARAERLREVEVSFGREPARDYTINVAEGATGSQRRNLDRLLIEP